MAAAVWPDYAAVGAPEYAPRRDPDVRRTQFDDGMVRQARAFTSSMTVRSVVAHLSSDADLDRFRAWADDHAHEWFVWPHDDDGVRRRARVRGGAGGVAYRASVSSGVRRWRLECELEGLWSDTA